MIARILVIALAVAVFFVVIQVNLFVRLLAIPIVIVVVWDLFNHWRDKKRPPEEYSHKKS